MRIDTSMLSLPFAGSPTVLHPCGGVLGWASHTNGASAWCVWRGEETLDKCEMALANLNAALDFLFGLRTIKYSLKTLKFT